MSKTNELKELKAKLFELQDEDYKQLQSSLIPNMPESRIIGVRIPDLRKLAKTYVKEKGAVVLDFMHTLPHFYLEGETLHMLFIELESDPEVILENLDEVLPTLTNWASADTGSFKAIMKNKELSLKYINKWLNSDYTYANRFAIRLLKEFFLEDEYEEKYLDRVARINTNEYYIQLMVAWYIAEALVKQYDDAVKLLEDGVLELNTHNEAINKAIDSHRIPDETKAYLKTLRREGGALKR